MLVEIVETPLASAQAARLRGPAARVYQAFLDDLHRRGCAALGYRVTEHQATEHATHVVLGR